MPCRRAAILRSSKLTRCIRSTRSSGTPSRTTTAAVPLMVRRAHDDRNWAYALTITQNAIVPTASIAPVSEKSSWVTPCWTRSPMVTRRMRSKGDISASSRLPTPRMTNHRKK